MVGAGIAGASLAWHLAGPRCRVLILEQGRQPLGEASAQNAGMLRCFVAGEEERALACKSRLRIDSLASHPDWEGAAPLRTTGAVLALAEPDPRYEPIAADLRARGIRCEAADPRLLGRVAPAMAGSPVTEAWWLPDEGLCDAWTLGQGFLRGARRRRAELRTGVEVLELTRRGDRIAGVITDRGPIDAGIVVLAAGAWSDALARRADLTGPELTPKARHLLQSAPHPLGTRDHPWCWIDDVGLYVRPEAGGFLVSPCDETDRFPKRGAGSGAPVEALGRALAHEKLTRYLPALADLRLVGGWRGLRTFTPDRSLRAGFDPTVDGLYWMAGLGGCGVSVALALGERCAAELQGVTT